MQGYLRNKVGGVMFSSYKEEDVTILLKDISGMVTPLSTKEREKRIQSGTHYSEMLPIEYAPTQEYIRIYNDTLEEHAQLTGHAVSKVAEKIIAKKGKNVILVSLARAGIPIGILIKRYIESKYAIKVTHYTISIIRGRGIDEVAMNYILERHKAEDIQFIDGWTGKGAILKELKKELQRYEGISNELAVLSDPAWITDMCGTHEDFLIPSSCLNATISGLLSRTFLHRDYIKPTDFHGAMFYKELMDQDVSYEFIDTVQKYFKYDIELEGKEGDIPNTRMGQCEVYKIAQEFNIKDINFVKPGIGETTRVLLRRVPWKILVKDKNDIKYLKHILRLAEEKNVEVMEYPLIAYRACGIIKDLSADL